jgi:hypothetical protein
MLTSFNDSMPKRPLWLLAVPLLLTSAMAGAAVEDGLGDLEERVNQRWTALIDRDFDAVYKFQTPAYREAYSFRHFAGQYGSQVRWISAELENFSLAESPFEDQEVADQLRVANVQVRLEYQSPFPPENPVRTTTIVDEKWLFVDDQWWFGK